MSCDNYYDVKCKRMFVLDYITLVKLCKHFIQQFLTNVNVKFFTVLIFNICNLYLNVQIISSNLINNNLS